MRTCTSTYICTVMQNTEWTSLRTNVHAHILMDFATNGKTETRQRPDDDNGCDAPLHSEATRSATRQSNSNTSIRASSDKITCSQRYIQHPFSSYRNTDMWPQCSKAVAGRHPSSARVRRGRLKTFHLESRHCCSAII